MFEFSLKLNAQIYTFQHFNTKPRLAILALLRCVAHDFACHFGIKCSSFSKVNRGTSRRSACDPIGFCEYHSVRIGNILLERTGFERLNMDRIFISIISTHVNQFEFICPSIRNCLFCRTSLLVLLTTALGGVWTLEQPSGSVLEYYPTWREVMCNIFRCGGDHAVFSLEF